MDFKVCDTVKRLNALRHQTASKQKKLEELQTQYNQMMKDASEAVATDKGESADAQVIRPSKKVPVFRVTRPYLNLLMKPRIFLVFLENISSEKK